MIVRFLSFIEAILGREEGGYLCQRDLGLDPRGGKKAFTALQFVASLFRSNFPFPFYLVTWSTSVLFDGEGSYSSLRAQQSSPDYSFFRARQAVDDALGRIRQEVKLQREKSNSMCQLRTAHDWVDYKTNVFDDNTVTFFWRAHTLTVLFCLICVLVYVGIFEDPVDDSSYNGKRGLIAVSFFWVVFGMTIMPDGPFLRPHPAIWRMALAGRINRTKDLGTKADAF